MKIPFKIAVNRIGDKYFVVSADDESTVKMSLCCDEITAYLFSLMTEDLTQNQMLEFAKRQFPETEEALLLDKVLKVQEYIRNIDPESTELEVARLWDVN